MMSYGSEILFGGSDNVLEWDKPQCIFKLKKKVFLNRQGFPFRVDGGPTTYSKSERKTLARGWDGCKSCLVYKIVNQAFSLQWPFFFVPAVASSLGVVL